MFGTRFTEWTAFNVFIRIIVALILSCIIGFNIGVKRRGAGPKTCSVVCMGATLVMLTGQYLSIAFPGKVDMTRMAAQVISGVGFLGVGTIIVSGQHVRGLTTAASLWACACVGLAAGAGFIDGSIVVAVFLVGSMNLLSKIELYRYHHSRHIALYIEISNSHVVAAFLDEMNKNSIRVDSCDLIEGKGKHAPFSLQVMLYLPKNFEKSRCIDAVKKIEGVVSVDLI